MLVLFEPITGERWIELQRHNLAEEVVFRDFQGWVTHCKIEEDPHTPNLFRWVIEMESIGGTPRRFSGKFVYRGEVIRPVYSDRFHRKAVI